ncbi:CRB_1a_G0054690.mRNA.1.CDS.1 [Saccharomyces cerevisiae]|nr:CRB_1a_G0054690.mRNA.1.CDS.1 [Saccharomyces cerevisiae]CAI7479645.1 CRB_1a_G0054690.mRNA.1.CDS.1 [Saccharomyces cerevisiae]
MTSMPKLKIWSKKRILLILTMETLSSASTTESTTTIRPFVTSHSYVASSTPYSNISSLNEDYDNAGNFLAPTTVALAVLLTILLFIQAY